MASEVEFGTRVNTLGLRLVRALTAADDRAASKNMLLSPVSLFGVLALLVEGAVGEARDELVRLLLDGGREGEDWNAAEAGRYLSSLSSQIGASKFKTCSSLWSTAPAREEYKSTVQQVYETEVFSTLSVPAIDSWVDKATSGLIKAAPSLPQQLLDRRSPVYLLINVAYFHGVWLKSFERHLTVEDTPFKCNDGSTVKVPMMHQKSKQFCYHENDLVQCLTLPYAAQDKEPSSFQLNIVLPRDPNVPLARFVEESFSHESWSSWLAKSKRKEGELFLPRFKLQSNVGCDEALKSLGAAKVYVEGGLSALSGGAWLDRLQHSTVLVLDEDGTRVAAVSVAVVLNRCRKTTAPFQMQCNRPFLITVSDRETGTMLFLALVEKPDCLDPKEATALAQD